MKQKVILLLLFCFSGFAQQPLHSSMEIEKFANYLFAKRDFLRASEQFLALPPDKINDTINLRLAKCYLELDTIELSDIYLAKVTRGNLAASGTAARYRYLFKNGRYTQIISDYEQRKGLTAFTSHFIHPLYHAVSWRERLTKPDDKDALKLFIPKDQDSISYYRQELLNTAKKSPVTAALLSAIIPGAGKIYTGNYGDGVMAFVSTGLFAYLSIYNIQHHHTAKAYIFTSLAGLYYGANIYGSAASAQIYNAQYLLNLQLNFDSFITKRNCFLNGGGIGDIR